MMGGRKEGQMSVWVDRWMHGQMDDGWINGCLDGW